MAEVIDGFVEKRLRESIKRSPVRGEIKIPREGDGDIHLRSVRFLSDFFKKNGYQTKGKKNPKQERYVKK